MKIVHTLSKIVSNQKIPVILTIGNFDGVHIGHKSLLSKLIKIAKKHSTQSAVITFANHPSTVLTPGNPTPLLCSMAHKIRLLEEANIDLLIVLAFTKEFAEQSAEHFLKNILRILPIDTLLVGTDVHFGKNREADAAVISHLAKLLHFKVEFAEDFLFEQERVTSTRIRNLIKRGDFSLVEKLLGRKYSIYAPVIKGEGKGTTLGFPTTNISVDELCIPPLGVYVVTLKDEDSEYLAVANLGIAPTIRQQQAPILEVHLLEKNIDLYGKDVEVIFHCYIRPEKQFASIEQLKEQISLDIEFARNYHQKRSD